MAEAVGLAASIIAIVQLADSIASVCRLCIESIDGCPKDLRVVLIQSSSARAVFDNLRFLLQHDPQASALLNGLSGENGPIEGCYSAITELEKLLPSEYLAFGGEDRSPGSTRRRVKLTLAVLAWPLKQTRARELLERISQYQMTINTAFSQDIWRGVRDIKQNLNEVKHAITASERQKICEWLQRDNPSPNHNVARGLYEDGTCNWISRLPDWVDWIQLQTRCLWIHGIPGCGKTVLAAHLADNTARLCEKQPSGRCAVVYYYCHHSRNKDETLSFLSWIVTQLCRKAGQVPMGIYNLYEMGCQPSKLDLLAALQAALEYFETVYVLIDALDESQHREVLLGAISTIVVENRFRKVQLLATSREYHDIQQVMTDISRSIPMANAYVETDIKVFVGTKLRSTAKFQKWPRDLRDTVKQRLAREAGGMFRWAVCQLDILRRLSNSNDVLKALYDLPRTLDETYHRIFASVDQDDWPFLRHVLQMICFYNSLYGHWTDVKLSASIIFDSYSLRVPQESITGPAHFYSMESLRDICGCIVTFQEDNVLGGNSASLAHYTVREFLESKRVMLGAGAYFSLDPEETDREMARLVFAHALDARFEEAPRAWPYHKSDPYLLAQVNLDTYCLFSASSLLYDMEKLVRDEEKLTELAFQLLNPTSPRFFARNAQMRRMTAWTTDMFRDSVGRGQRFWDIHWNQTPGYAEGGTLTILLWSSLFRLAEKLMPGIDPRALRDAKLELSAVVFKHGLMNEMKLGFQGNILGLFTLTIPSLHEGARAAIFILRHFPGLFDPRPFLIAVTALHRHEGQCSPDCHFLQALGLLVGPQPLDWGIMVTPLQVAAGNGDHCAVEAFLKAGMDPNGAGVEGDLLLDPDTVASQPWDHLRGATSLRIVRQTYGYYIGRKLYRRIERLLLEYGAREY